MRAFDRTGQHLTDQHAPGGRNMPDQRLIASAPGTAPHPVADVPSADRPPERTVVRGGESGESYVRIRVPRGGARVQSLRWEGATGTLAPADPPSGPPADARPTPTPPVDGNGAPARGARPATGEGIVLPGLGSRQVVAGSPLGGR